MLKGVIFPLFNGYGQDQAKDCIHYEGRGPDIEPNCIEQLNVNSTYWSVQQSALSWKCHLLTPSHQIQPFVFFSAKSPTQQCSAQLDQTMLSPRGQKNKFGS